VNKNYTPEKSGLKRMPSPDQRFVHDHAVSMFWPVTSPDAAYV